MDTHTQKKNNITYLSSLNTAYPQMRKNFSVIPSNYYQPLGWVLAMIDYLLTVCLVDEKLQTLHKDYRKRNSRTKSISQLEQHAHCRWADTHA